MRVASSFLFSTHLYLFEGNEDEPGFVDRLRVEAARPMLDSSDVGLEEIADHCGFQNADSMRRISSERLE
jgi:transcriptional regulator GlxA family with amidase domain